MLKIAKEPVRFFWPVKYTQPDPNNSGRHLTQTFEGQFVLVGNDEWLEILENTVRAKDGMLREVDPMSMEEFQAETAASMRRIFVGWKEGDIQDEDGRPVPVNDETMNYLLNIAGMSAAISAAYQDARSGGANSKARKKT